MRLLRGRGAVALLLVPAAPVDAEFARALALFDRPL